MIFNNFTFPFDAIEMGLYFVIVGYYFLLFAFFLTMRFRTSKKIYWLFFSLLFLCLAAGRVFFIGYYFFIPEVNVSKAEIARSLMLFYRIATFFSWLAIACFMGILGILLFPPEAEPDEKSSKLIQLTPQMKTILRIILIAIPIFVGILALLLPDSLLMDPDIAKEYNINISIHTIWGYPTGRFILLVLVIIFVFVIPFLFIYLAIKTYGVLRKSYLLNGIGILIYYIGRILQGAFEVLKWHHFEATVPPLLILCALLLLVIANNYEQLR
ncbi:MAG: hypothetical protein EU540_07750 [Promethearchaeota archaeon]|nr:MAG: hypothetical protein EU540_07750 [Candidatus Lokiarchaeota archaeon]